jgi:hypothetical protein
MRVKVGKDNVFVFAAGEETVKAMAAEGAVVDDAQRPRRV